MVKLKSNLFSYRNFRTSKSYLKMESFNFIVQFLVTITSLFADFYYFRLSSSWVYISVIFIAIVIFWNAQQILKILWLKSFRDLIRIESWHLNKAVKPQGCGYVYLSNLKWPSIIVCTYVVVLLRAFHFLEISWLWQNNHGLLNN